MNTSETGMLAVEVERTLKHLDAAARQRREDRAAEDAYWKALEARKAAR